MTRFSVAIDSAGQQGRPTYSDSLGFVADTLTIVNPTVSTVYILAGGSTVPSSYANATDSVPPLSVRSLPVNSATFAVGFGSPTYPVTQPNPTTVATLLFTAGEPTPQYGAIPPAAFQLSGTINVSVTNAVINANITNSTINAIGLLGADTLISQSGSLAAGVHSFTIPLAAGGRGVMLALGNPQNVSALSITGVTTGFVYIASAPQSQPSTAAGVYRVPVLSTDSSVVVALTVIASMTASFEMWSTGGLSQGMLAADGPLLTRPTPPPLSYYKQATSGDVAIPASTPAFGGGFAFSALPGTNCRIAGAQCTASSSAAAGQVRVRVCIKDSGGSLWATLLEAFSAVGAYTNLGIPLDVPLPAGFFCVGEYLNNDTVARFASVSAVLIAQQF